MMDKESMQAPTHCRAPTEECMHAACLPTIVPALLVGPSGTCVHPHSIRFRHATPRAEHGVVEGRPGALASAVEKAPRDSRRVVASAGNDASPPPRMREISRHHRWLVIYY